jgi:hypothetical protein
MNLRSNWKRRKKKRLQKPSIVWGINQNKKRRKISLPLSLPPAGGRFIE